MIPGILLGLLTLIASLLFIRPPAWFPLGISSAAMAYDRQFQFTLLTTGSIFIGAQILLAFVIVRYRGSRRAVLYTHGNNKVEMVWTAATALIFLGLALSGTRTWAGMHFAPLPSEPEIIEVYAQQFAWNFRYPGPDRKFGRTDIRLINDAAQNPMGLDDRDPASRDDILSASLKVPVGKDITLILRARDVIHDFFVRELRLKQDVVPGMDIPYRFRASRTGRYEIACAELCGLGHSQMRGLMEVMSQDEFERWKQAQAHK